MKKLEPHDTQSLSSYGNREAKNQVSSRKESLLHVHVIPVPWRLKEKDQKFLANLEYM